MGTRGPIPKHPDQRRRTNKSDTPIERGFGASEVEVPAAKKSWHPAAKAWYESLAGSGQSQWYEPSDWATAFVVAESMSRDLKPRVIGVNRLTLPNGDEVVEPVKESMPINGASLGAYLKAMSVLLVTEGDRRRAAIQLERPPGGDEGKEASVSWLDQSRRGSSG